jgi:uncharacterized damage-inducible protein DinB
MQAYLLLALYDYNRYANRLVFECAARLEPADLVRQASPSHDSAFGILQHLLATETGFLDNALGEPFSFQRASNLEELRLYSETLAEKQLAYLQAISEEALLEDIPARIGRQDFHFPRWQLLAQGFVHSTHHRGELSIVMTALGQPLPTLDIIIPFAENSGQPWPWKQT